MQEKRYILIVLKGKYEREIYRIAGLLENEIEAGVRVAKKEIQGLKFKRVEMFEPSTQSFSEIMSWLKTL